MLTLTFLGTSSGVPTRQRNVTGLAVQTSAGADWFLVDAGEGTQQQLQHTRLSLNDLAAICITHVHGDHCYGLPGLLASAGMAGRKRPLTLIAPPPVWDWLNATRACTDLQLAYEVTHVDVDSASTLWAAPGVRIEAHPLRHRVPSHAYSVQVESRRIKLDVDALHAVGLPPGPQRKALQSGEDVTHAGRVLRSEDFATHQTQRVRAVIGGDNADVSLLGEACKDAQLLVHEATYTQPVLDKVGPGPMHSSARQVAAFAQAIGLPNLVLTHFSPRYHNPEGLAELEAEARSQYPGALWLAKDFDVYDLDAAGVLNRRETLS
ncbi:ribonuclease Z [Variovorax sp. J22R133]|uniref:ribonuclease Z n=1 Tax=Variovorax brevis TaxID=3053503 RepID=UPI002576B3EE|nr:ribonuclease Z [Variovorax sp. J22R133]MDM0115735.1 ribonuclease Z [Variovorax sp. J22R133]